VLANNLAKSEQARFVDDESEQQEVYA